MLENLRLKNFKCFSNLSLPLRPMTVLTGLNGSGKSSVLQSLLLLRQSYNNATPNNIILQIKTDDITVRLAGDITLRLKGDLVEFGRASDVFFDPALDNKLEFELAADNQQNRLLLSWLYDLSKNVFDHLIINDTFILSETSLFNDHFHYICADRWGPRVALPLSEYHITHHNLGKQGEYVVHYLLTQGEHPLPNSQIPLYHEELGNNLLAQTQIWMNEISPGTRIILKEFTEIESATALFAFQSEVGFTKGFRPVNVGFGLSYTLPVIVALLSLPQDGLVLLENPEAHLHPRGQTLIGKLMAQVAAAGTQVIVETHSDHVLNGIRIAVKEKQLAPEQTAFHYFARHQGKVEVVSPLIDADGRLDQWPEGFFDETAKNLAALAAGLRPRIKPPKA